MKKNNLLGIAVFCFAVAANADNMTSSNVQNSNSVNATALSKMRVMTNLDSVDVFTKACIEGNGVSLNAKEYVAASGYDLASVPYDALDNPDQFCKCAINVAANANLVASKKAGVYNSAASELPSESDFKRIMMLSKTTVGSPSCKAGKWRVDFRSDGLALYKNGVAIFGGEKQLIAAKEVSNSNVKSQAWVE